MRICIIILIICAGVSFLRGNKAAWRAMKPITSVFVNDQTAQPEKKKLPPIGSGTSLVGAKLEPAKKNTKRK